MPGIIQKTCQPDTGTPASPDASAWQQSKVSQSGNHPPCNVRPGQVDTWARKSPKTTQGALGPLFKVFSCNLKLYRTDKVRLLQADFFVGKVTTRIFRPHVTLCPGAGAGIAIANWQPLALATAPLDRARMLTQLNQQRVRVLQPDVGKAALAHVAHRVLPPVGVGMNVTKVVDIGDAGTGCVAAPGAQHALHLPGVFGHGLLHPLQQQNTVGIVISTDNVGFYAALHISPGALENLRHGPARHAAMRIHRLVALAAATVIEVRQLVFLYLILAHQIQQRRQLRIVVLGQCGAQANLEIFLAAQAYAIHGGSKAALHASKFVMNVRQSVNADTNIVEVAIGDLFNIAIVDQGTVGG